MVLNIFIIKCTHFCVLVDSKYHYALIFFAYSDASKTDEIFAARELLRDEQPHTSYCCDAVALELLEMLGSLFHTWKPNCKKRIIFNWLSPKCIPLKTRRGHGKKLSFAGMRYFFCSQLPFLHPELTFNYLKKVSPCLNNHFI